MRRLVNAWAADLTGGVAIAWRRRLPTLATRARRSPSPSPRRVIWAGRDAADRPVASGVYFVRLTVGEEAATRRLVLIR